MNWIDIRIRKPTEADGDEHGKVLQLLNDGECSAWRWENIRHTVAWMPIPPFNPPEIPEGWRVVDVATEKKTGKMKYWGPDARCWIDTCGDVYTKNFLYITPIETKYRPFANAAEFRPFRDRWWRWKDEPTIYPPMYYRENGIGIGTWEDAFGNCLFEDGTPFGMKVEQ